MANSGITKTAWKLQEIVAHASNVSAIALGKSSGRLLATGGEDCRVNLWSVNKPNCIMSLTGHTSPVESVRFSASEKLIVAGSQSGSLRVWNMEEAKIQRTLMGHKANVCSLDFHPYGEFVASGSLDTNIKLWDVRRKGCVFRYKGHTQAVRCLRFSPDGKWLASSSDDHTIKLWDISAGKLMSEFTEHTGPVQIVEFHPNEYLLASASGDRTVRFWDLEKFQSVGCMEGEATPFRSILFSSDGGCLFCGGRDALRIYGWEPERCFDTVPVAWGKVSDLSICNNQLIGVSSTQSNVSSFVVDLNRVKMTGSGSEGCIPKETPVSQTTPTGSSLRRNYERPSTTCTKPKRVSPTSDDEEKESRAEIQNAEDYKEIFQPKMAISRTPPRNTEPFPAPPEDDSTMIKEAVPATPEVITALPTNKKTSEQIHKPPVAASTPTVCQEPPAVSNNPPVISAARNEPIGLKVADFLPVVKGSSPAEIVDEEAVCQIRKGHDTMCMVLTSRMRNLDTVRAVWSTGDIKTSMDSAVAVNDLSVVVDLLNIINQKASLWKLDLCLTVLPQIDKLLQSKYESYVQTGCISLKLLLQRFLPLITDTLSAPPSVGVDISREERLMKCKLCYKQLKGLYVLVKSRAMQTGRYGSAFRELHLLMSGLE
ncbi:katanin p80 WD40 repeat-containing subunit B1 [Hyla sarda]|uniref:katanin p80 WD40 repeat-containing subunit B1 n=1 Tax=Hyla sarda TaxID=327740 RepID=UPI0024C3AB99|nr:katanin p80 WD40 repeat-containing subunit B1 [Hyla sarda]XP_056381331.1 katanin p80 WD40 repeat-containing subunit B1 [Hyla sarda]XP_056381332.1 katanin p80 WD40 repeat-containing subunit B1 [Hyla sarda]XP_056381333.1 katanin p80 WD40 repeat-containing subunit B1 [Hyla sarda]XP_056381334.1 katanin p80 WD40 repeat-containing subunit B1 [Hyla sarda]